MFERLGKLRSSGLPLQTALVLARFATSGDAVYVSQCQVIAKQDATPPDQIAVAGTRKLLNFLNTEVQSPVERWFQPWNEGGWGMQ
jgi:hypothetical protein